MALPDRAAGSTSTLDTTANQAAAAAASNDALARSMPVLFVLIWSTGFVVARYAMPHAPPMHFLAVRFGLSLICFAGWVTLAGARWPQGRSQWLHLAVVGTLMHAGYLGGVWSAVKAGLGAGTVALLVGLQPVLTALWVAGRGVPSSAGWLHGGRPRGIGPRQWLGLALGLAGLLLVVWRKLGSGEMTPGNLALALFGLLGITVGTLYQKRWVQPCDVRSASAVQLIAALAVSLPFALAEPERVVWNAPLLGALAWSVGVLTLGGNSLLYLLIQRGAATAVTSLMYLVPPCTAALAWALFDEPFTATMALGLLSTALGVALVVQPVKGR